MATTTTKKDELTIDANGSLSDALQQLITQYNNTPSYTARTNEELRAAAEGEYSSYYDQLRLAARQSQEQQDLALQQQREGLQDTYDKQREAARKEYEDAYSRADRQMLSRGMQRSSYTAQILANLTQQGADAQQAIWDKQAAAEGNIDAQRNQLAQQLAQQLLQYDANQASDVLKRIRELEDQDYERGMTSLQYKNSLSAQIYQYMQQMASEKAEQDRWQAEMDYQKQRDAIADAQWQQQFAENQRQFNEQLAYKQAGASSSGSSGRSSSSKSGSSGTPNVSGGLSWNDFMGMMGGSGGVGAGSSALNGATLGILQGIRSALPALAATTTTVNKKSSGGKGNTTVSVR